MAVLGANRDELRSRNELKKMTDVSRVTLSRILGKFEDREWIERTNGRLSRATFILCQSVPNRTDDD